MEKCLYFLKMKKVSDKKSRRMVSVIQEKSLKGKPTSVKVGYRDIKLEWIKPDFKTDTLTDCFGWYLPREGKIQIQNSLDNQEEANTLLHEILHAIAYGSGLNQAEGPLKDEHSEELVVNQITNYLMGAFRDNPWLLDYIKDNIDNS
jgi:hypothetical protein|tara:strand:- start:43 stop:483 length:441 start_codon:yes stop_codon:yes gene_type:complete